MSAAITTVSWIPSESLTGPMRAAFAVGVGHYDPPPGDRVGTLDEFRASGRGDAVRFAHRLAAWAEIDAGEVVSSGYEDDSGGVMGSSTLRVGPAAVRFEAVALPLLREKAAQDGNSVVYVQTFGGRTAWPLPRLVAGAPFVRVVAPIVWTTLTLTLRADGTSTGELSGASVFPRHWVFDQDGTLAAKSGLADFDAWMQRSRPDATPWGSVDSPALVSEVESALERQLSEVIMRGGAKPRVRSVPPGAVLTREGETGTDIFLVLDGVLGVEVDGVNLGELGPGAVVGERAALEAGVRTATLTALSPVRVAVADRASIDLERLRELTALHRREETPPAG